MRLAPRARAKAPRRAQPRPTGGKSTHHILSARRTARPGSSVRLQQRAASRVGGCEGARASGSSHSATRLGAGVGPHSCGARAPRASRTRSPRGVAAPRRRPPGRAAPEISSRPRRRPPRLQPRARCGRWRTTRRPRGRPRSRAQPATSATHRGQRCRRRRRQTCCCLRAATISVEAETNFWRWMPA